MPKHFTHPVSRNVSPHRKVAAIAVTLLLLNVLVSSSAAAQEQVLFPAIHDAQAVLLQKIRNERVRIDVGIWILGDFEVVQTLINKFTIDKVPVRVLGDRAIIFETDPDTRRAFEMLANAGVPIRLRYNPTWFPEIMHWKAMIFAGQGMVEFGSANYTVYELKPWSATDFKDESAMFTDDPAIVNAFRTKFDQYWVDTAYFKDWADAYVLETGITWTAPMTIPRGRQEPDYPTNIPGMIWGQGPELNSAIIAEIDRETRGVDMMFYRLTVPDITDALIRKYQSGVPVRIITEPTQYRNDKWPEFWLVGAMVDRLIAAGIPVKQRLHAGLTHIKGMITSNVALNASANFAKGWERDHNYFIAAQSKPLLYAAYRQRFDQMWSDGVNYGSFRQQPPYPPTLVGPASRTVNVPTKPTLEWKRAPFATSFDVYLGTSQDNMTPTRVNARLDENPPDTYTFTPAQALKPSTVYYWRVVSRTFGADSNPVLVAGSEIRSFRTSMPGTNDFDGDGRTDISVYRPSTGTWFVLQSAAGYAAAQAFSWGVATDIPVPGDYDGDGRIDPAVYRPSSGTWFVLTSSGNLASASTYQWGIGSDVPVPGDYDGDGKADPTVFRPSAGVWFILKSSTGFTTAATYQWGAVSDRAVPADYDGDGVTDLAVYRPSGTWFILRSSTNFSMASTYQWGISSDIAVPGDYDGDGKADVAVFRPSDGVWFILKSSTGYATAVTYVWGANGDKPVVGDYDGDGKADLAVYRPSSTMWFILTSSSNYSSALTISWGAPTDLPGAQTQ